MNRRALIPMLAFAWALVLTPLASRCSEPAAEHPATEHADHADAADHAHGHDDHAAGGHGAHTIHGEAPKNYFGEKTEFLYWSPQLFLWTLLLFLPLWFLLSRLVWGPMMRAIEDRDRRIVDSLETARRLRAEAKAISSEQDADTMRAQQEARSIIEQARTDAAKEIADMVAEARTAASQKLDYARRQLEESTRQGESQIARAAEKLGQSIVATLRDTGGNG